MPANPERPAPGAVFVADVLGAIFAYAAIQTALVQRGRTGEGQRIDVALMDCMLNLLVYELQEAQFPVTTPRPTYGPVRAADGDVLVVPITRAQLRRAVRTDRPARAGGRSALRDPADAQCQLGGDDGRSSSAGRASAAWPTALPRSRPPACPARPTAIPAMRWPTRT